MRSALLLLWLVPFAGCACDPDEACHVEGPAEDGSSALVCPDGSRVLFPATHAFEGRGALQGDVRLFGLPPVAGLRVRLGDTEQHTTVTDADGHFLLERIPPGFHTLVFDAPGYARVEQRELLVLPGFHSIPDVVLHPGRLVVPGTGQLFPSPRGDGCLYLTGEVLYRYTAATGLTELVSRSASRPEYAYGGSAILFLDLFEASSERGTLVLLDLDSGERTSIARPASQWTVSADGSAIAVVARSPGGVGLALAVWDRESGVTKGVADHVQDFRLTPDGRRLTLLATTDSFGGASTLILWDVAAQAGTSLGAASWPLPLLSPDGSSLVYRTAAGEHVLWDAVRQRAQRLGPDVQLDGAAFDDSGRFLLFRDTQWRFVLHDVATDTDERLDPTIFDARLAPGDGGLITVGSRTDGLQELVLEELPGHRLHQLFADGWIADWAALPDELLFRTIDASGSGTLRRFSVGGGGFIVAGAVPQAPVFDPLSERILFLSGEELLRRERGGSSSEQLMSGVKPGAWLDHGPADGDALVFEWAVDGSGGRLSRYDTLLGRAVRIGDGVPFQTWQGASDGSLVALRGGAGRGGPGELVVHQRGARSAQLLAAGVSSQRSFRRSLEGARVVSWREDPAWGSSVAELHDLPRNATVPLAPEVGDAAVGAGFVAYVIAGSGEAVGLQPPGGLVVSRWPEDPPEPAPPLPLPEDPEGPPPPPGPDWGGPR